MHRKLGHKINFFSNVLYYILYIGINIFIVKLWTEKKKREIERKYKEKLKKKNIL